MRGRGGEREKEEKGRGKERRNFLLAREEEEERVRRYRGRKFSLWFPGDGSNFHCQKTRREEREGEERAGESYQRGRERRGE